MTLALSPANYRTVYGHRSQIGADHIRELYEDRKTNMGADIARMREIEAVNNDDLWIPLPELTQTEKPMVSNLVAQGLRSLSQRIASVQANVYFPALNPEQPRSVKRAQDRTRVMRAWHHDTHLKRMTGKRARHFLGFASAPVCLKPNAVDQRPHWWVRSPLFTFPSETRWDTLVPLNCIFETQVTYRWLLEHYPDQASLVRKPHWWNPEDPQWDLKFRLLEFIDDYECSHIICSDPGPDDDVYKSGMYDNVMLSSYPNLAGRCTVVIPGSINLTDQRGHFDGIIGMYQARAEIMALAQIAQRRAVFAREWAEAYPNNPNGIVEIVSIPDPYSGTPGQVNGGSIKQATLDPSLQAMDLIDRTEGAERMSAGLPPEFGGASSTNVRTGRRGAQVMGAAVDFTISEAQDVFAESLNEENQIAIAIDKAYFNHKKVYQIATRSYSGTVSYTPSDLWETDKHVVDYAMGGVDLQNLPIEGGQRVMMNTMSRETFMEIDPVIADVDAEKRRIFMEGLETAFVSQIQTLAGMPEGPFQPADVGRMMKLASEDKEPWEIIDILQKEAQERQATEVPQGDPAAMPGLSPPGQGMEQPTPTEPDMGMDAFTQQLGQLGQVQQAGRYRS